MSLPSRSLSRWGLCRETPWEITKAGSMHPTGMLSCYWPQRSWAKVIFSQACVILSTGGEGVCLSACWDTSPLGADTPPGSRPPRSIHPPGADTPPTRHPPGADPPGADPPPGSRLQHTVYERPVRILLECILVRILFTEIDFQLTGYYSLY